jgi:uncharacterized coiled-coil protein SlyX
VSEDRLTELEVKVAFQDKLIADLDEVVRGLRDEIERLVEEVGRLTEVIEPERGSVVDEKPPHY